VSQEGGGGRRRRRRRRRIYSFLLYYRGTQIACGSGEGRRIRHAK
jgi:hypothetical protein